MRNIYTKKTKGIKISIIKLIACFSMGFIVGNYMLYQGKLDNIATKITRLFSYDLIKTNVVKYEINYGENL